MAPSGYGKRCATDEDPRRRGDFGHLPEREAYLAAYIDRLPEGAAIDCKTLAKEQPRYGQAAVRSALNALSEAGHLRRFQETVEGLTQWVTYTYFSRTARDDAWWARFREGGVPEEEVASPDERPAAAPAPRRPPARSAAYVALAAVGAADARMMLSAADCAALEELAEEWLARGASAEQLVRGLTSGLPDEVQCPGAFARRRLVDKMPPERAASGGSPRRVMECTGCGMPGRPEALPGGLCRRCRGEGEREAKPVVPPAEVRARVGRLRGAGRVPVGAAL